MEVEHNLHVLRLWYRPIHVRGYVRTGYQHTKFSQLIMHTKHTDKHWTLQVHNSASTEHTDTQGTGLLAEDTEPNLQYTLASSHGSLASTFSYTSLYKFRNL